MNKYSKAEKVGYILYFISLCFLAFIGRDYFAKSFLGCVSFDLNDLKFLENVVLFVLSLAYVFFIVGSVSSLVSIIKLMPNFFNLDQPMMYKKVNDHLIFSTMSSFGFLILFVFYLFA